VIRGRFSSNQLAFGGLFAITFLGMLAIGATLPVLPLYVRGPIGSGDIAVGFVTGAFAITGLTFRPLGGYLADIRGRRRIVVIGSLLMSLAGVMYFIPAGVPGLIAARLALGAGEAMVYAAGAAWVFDLAPTERQGRLIGIYGLAVWAGLALGAPIGNVLLSAASFEVVWLFAAAAPLVAAVIASRIPEHYRARKSAGSHLLVVREALVPGTGLALGTVGFTTLAAFIVLHLDDLEIGHGAEVFTAFAASVVIVRLAGGGLPDRFGGGPTAVAAGIVSAIGLVIIAAAQTLEFVLIGAVVLGAAFSLMFPALALLVVSRTPKERRGLAVGTFTAFFDVAVGIGTPIAGGIAALSGYPAAFLFAAVCALGLAVVGVVSLPRRVDPALGSGSAA
jgi:MFS family permease